jgi:hypothetical protein
MSNGLEMPHVFKWLAWKWTCVIKRFLISCICSCMCNLLYEYEWMKSMYNMFTICTICCMQLDVEYDNIYSTKAQINYMCHMQLKITCIW